jgi:type IV pilus assembly protein PilE
MKSIKQQAGYTLVELMITVGIIGILAGIAIPAYNSYISTSAMATAQTNAKTLAGFEDNYFYENAAFLAGSYIPPGANGLAALDWEPTGDKDHFDYVVTAGSTGDIATSYTITVTYKLDTAIVTTLSKP